MTLDALKRLVFERLLKEGRVAVLLEPRVRGVMLPPAFREQCHISLTYALDLPDSIMGVTATEVGLHATLAFPHEHSGLQTTFVPWVAIHGIGLVAGGNGGDHASHIYASWIPTGHTHDEKLTETSVN
jgi:hypothetical protein